MVLVMAGETVGFQVESVSQLAFPVGGSAMPKNASRANDTWALVAYSVLAYAFSWAIGVPLALAHHGLISPVLPPWTHYLVAYGPLLSALIVTGVSRGWPGLKDLGRRMTLLRVCPRWWVTAFFPLFLGFGAMKLLNALTDRALRLVDLGQVNFLPPLGLGALLLWILTFGLGEETGWRGFALPRLQKGRNALVATFILAVIWALWHLPQFFYLFDPGSALGWALGLFAGSVVLTWLYNSTQNSVFMASIWHGCFNFLTASTSDTGALPAVMTVIVIVWAGIVIIRHKPKHLISL